MDIVRSWKLFRLKTNTHNGKLKKRALDKFKSTFFSQQRFSDRYIPFTCTAGCARMKWTIGNNPMSSCISLSLSHSRSVCLLCFMVTANHKFSIYSGISIFEHLVTQRFKPPRWRTLVHEMKWKRGKKSIKGWTVEYRNQHLFAPQSQPWNDQNNSQIVENNGEH